MNGTPSLFSAGLVGFLLGGAAVAGVMLAAQAPPAGPPTPMSWPASAAFQEVDPDAIAARLLPPAAERSSPESWVRNDDGAGLHMKYAAYVANGPSIRSQLIDPLTRSLEQKLAGPEMEALAAIERSLPTMVAAAGAIVGTRDASREIIRDGVYCRCALPYSIDASSGIVQSVLVATGDSAYLVVTVREYPSRLDESGKTNSASADQPLGESN
ncbi:MAG TPA: hypothetical protein VGE52_04520 [Pirellulales bacterium]